MAAVDRETLQGLARKYLWWQPPQEAAAHPDRVIAQLMDIGDYGDVRDVAHRFGDQAFRDAIRHAQPGWFRPRSWSYWHYRLGLCRPEDPAPPPPGRRLA